MGNMFKYGPFFAEQQEKRIKGSFPKTNYTFGTGRKIPVKEEPIKWGRESETQKKPGFKNKPGFGLDYKFGDFLGGQTKSKSSGIPDFMLETPEEKEFIGAFRAENEDADKAAVQYTKPPAKMVAASKKAASEVNDAFLKGFYSVADAATAIDKVFSSIKANEGMAPAPRMELHAAPLWLSPLEKSEDDTVNAGREYAANIIDDKFNHGWLYALGKENVYDYSSPIYNSRYKEVLMDSVKDNAKADMRAFAKASINPIRDTVNNSVRNYESLPKTGNANKDLLYMLTAIGAGAIETFLDDHLEGAKSVYKEAREKNERAAQSNRQHEYLNSSELKYLVDDKKAREKFIDTLLSEVEKIKSTKQLGYLPAGVNETFKGEAITALMRIIYLNQNYDRYSAERDAELQKLLKMQ